MSPLSEPHSRSFHHMATKNIPIFWIILENLTASYDNRDRRWSISQITCSRYETIVIFLCFCNERILNAYKTPPTIYQIMHHYIFIWI